MSIGKITITKKKTQQKINLRELLGHAPSDEQKKLFTEMAIERINERTLNRTDINNRKFTKYSKEYASKKGVTRNSVDLFLEGDMLSSIQPLEETRDTVVFGIDSSEEKQLLKSHGHNKGGGNLPQREFFGITEKEAKKIVKNLPKSDEETPDSRSEYRRDLHGDFIHHLQAVRRAADAGRGP